MVIRTLGKEENWLKTANGDDRGYIDQDLLRELWIHTGTVCNLRCPDCFEHSAPGDKRLEQVTLDDVRPFLDEAGDLGVERLSFTGGEPFVVKDTIRILDYALNLAPCLVLTNGTRPLRLRVSDIEGLSEKPNPLSFRVSLDYPDISRHDAQRGAGMFELALDSLGKLHRAGFHVSVARRREDAEDSDAVDAAFRPFFASVGLPSDTPIVSFPDLEHSNGPEITENCMTEYHTAESRANFMCAFSRMLLKQDGRMRVYACTLVDDHPHYDLGSSLRDASDARVRLGHQRCFACFAGGTSCSEL